MLKFNSTMTISLISTTMLILVFLLSTSISGSFAISCFECSSVNDTYCPDSMSSDDEDIVEYKDCGASLHEATYCVKTTGVTGGSGGSELHCFVCDETVSTKGVLGSWSDDMGLTPYQGLKEKNHGHGHVNDHDPDEDFVEDMHFGCSDPNFLQGRLKSCKDVFDAQYCIKTEGIWGGSLGTRRFCSSRDMGNYCDFIKRPGDQLEYRSCVYTCTGNGCNGSNSLTATVAAVFLSSSFLLGGVILRML